MDSVTALIQNSLFPVEKNYEMDLPAANRCADELVEFAHTVRHAVFVSDYIYSDAEAFSESTEMYRKCLADIDLPLSVAGRQELQNIRYDIKNVRFITSGMKQTDETMRILFGDAPYKIDSRFREVDFGIFEMHSYDQLKDTPEYQAWLAGDNEANIPPQGESGVQMRTRVMQAFSEIKEDTCIIAHGGVIATIMEHLFPEENKNRYEWQPKPGCGYTVTQHDYRTLK